MITLVGLGPGRRDSLTLGAYEALKSDGVLFLRTERHPAAEDLRSEGISFTALDFLYEQGADFDEVYARLAETVMEAGCRGDVTYAVPGHPLLGERSVE